MSPNDSSSKVQESPTTPNPVEGVSKEVDTPSPAPKAPHTRDEPTSSPDALNSQLDDALALASAVCDYNIRLAAHVETLRARVLELEDENATLRQREKAGAAVGVEKMVDVLQADIAGLQRELTLLKVAKRHTEADLEGLKAQNEMLKGMLSTTA